MKKNNNNILLSICIPTYNRPRHLENCLEAILISKKNCKSLNFEVCVSDNGSKHDIQSIIKKYKKKLNIKFNKEKLINELKAEFIDQFDLNLI